MDILGNLWKHFGIFLPQHLVTLFTYVKVPKGLIHKHIMRKSQDSHILIDHLLRLYQIVLLRYHELGRSVVLGTR